MLPNQAVSLSERSDMFEILHCVQNDIWLFCHSEERSDEESDGFFKILAITLRMTKKDVTLSANEGSG